jgi:hypothetical protein
MYNYNQYAKTYPQYFKGKNIPDDGFNVPNGYSRIPSILCTGQQYCTLLLEILEDVQGEVYVIFSDDSILLSGDGSLALKGGKIETTNISNLQIDGEKISFIFTNYNSVFLGDETLTNSFKGKIKKIILDYYTYIPAIDDDGNVVLCVFDNFTKEYMDDLQSESTTPFLKGE